VWCLLQSVGVVGCDRWCACCLIIGRVINRTPAAGECSSFCFSLLAKSLLRLHFLIILYYLLIHEAKIAYTRFFCLYRRWDGYEDFRYNYYVNCVSFPEPKIYGVSINNILKISNFDFFFGTKFDTYFSTREKSGLHSRTITKVWFSTFNYETE
jgi:hypothetical protein